MPLLRMPSPQLARRRRRPGATRRAVLVHRPSRSCSAVAQACYSSSTSGPVLSPAWSAYAAGEPATCLTGASATAHYTNSRAEPSNGMDRQAGASAVVRSNGDDQQARNQVGADLRTRRGGLTRGTDAPSSLVLVWGRGFSTSSGTDSALTTFTDVASGGASPFRIQSVRTRISTSTPRRRSTRSAVFDSLGSNWASTRGAVSSSNHRICCPARPGIALAIRVVIS